MPKAKKTIKRKTCEKEKTVNSHQSIKIELQTLNIHTQSHSSLQLKHNYLGELFDLDERKYLFFPPN